MAAWEIPVGWLSTLGSWEVEKQGKVYDTHTELGTLHLVEMMLRISLCFISGCTDAMITSLYFYLSNGTCG